MVDKGARKGDQKAFARARLGGGIGLSEADAIDDYAWTEEITRCKAQDERQDSQDIRRYPPKIQTNTT